MTPHYTAPTRRALMKVGTSNAAWVVLMTSIPGYYWVQIAPGYRRVGQYLVDRGEQKREDGQRNDGVEDGQHYLAGKQSREDVTER